MIFHEVVLDTGLQGFASYEVTKNMTSEVDRMHDEGGAYAGQGRMRRFDREPLRALDL